MEPTPLSLISVFYYILTYKDFLHCKKKNNLSPHCKHNDKVAGVYCEFPYCSIRFLWIVLLRRFIFQFNIAATGTTCTLYKSTHTYRLGFPAVFRLYRYTGILLNKYQIFWFTVEKIVWNTGKPINTLIALQVFKPVLQNKNYLYHCKP